MSLYIQEYPLDIRVLIASCDIQVWITMYLYDDEFKSWSKDYSSIHLFTTLFTKMISTYVGGRNIVRYTLFDKTHKIDGPALIIHNDTGIDMMMWYINNKIHRNDGPAIIADATQEWYINDIRHRDDGPAYIDAERKVEKWYFNGLKHRIDGPAVYNKSIQKWYFNGQLHRVDGPAVITKRAHFYYQNGLLHRDDGPAILPINVLIDESMDDWCENINQRFINQEDLQEWYINDKLHRIDGPSSISPLGDRYWSRRGVLHRVDGPAVINANGDERWYINGYLLAKNNIPGQ
jgi:hypothetical protein